MSGSPADDPLRRSLDAIIGPPVDEETGVPLAASRIPVCPECGYRDNWSADDRWWHCRGCGHAWRPGHVPWWERVAHRVHRDARKAAADE